MRLRKCVVSPPSSSWTTSKSERGSCVMFFWDGGAFCFDSFICRVTHSHSHSLAPSLSLSAAGPDGALREKTGSSDWPLPFFFFFLSCGNPRVRAHKHTTYARSGCRTRRRGSGRHPRVEKKKTNFKLSDSSENFKSSNSAFLSHLFVFEFSFR